MRAALFHGPGQAFELADVEPPPVANGEVLVRISASATCGGDLHRVSGGIVVDPLPSIIGHQVAGVVVQVGPGVPATVAEGTRVTVVPFDRCRTCRACSSGRDNLCANSDRTWSILRGFYGGYAELISVPHACAVPVPDSISLLDSASLPDAFGTPYHAVRLAHVEPGEMAVVLGVGDIGTALIQFLRLRGADVVAVDVNIEKLDLATALGATHTIDASRTAPLPAIADLTDGAGADLAFEAAGLEVTTHQAIDSVARGGRVVLVGATDEPIRELATMPTPPRGLSIAREVTLSGSWAMTTTDVHAVIDLAADGELDITTGRSVLPLDAINEGFDGKRDGTVTRLVFDLEASA